MNRTVAFGIALLVSLASTEPLTAQRAVAIGPTVHSEARAHEQFSGRDASRVVTGALERRPPLDSTKKRLTHAIIGGVAGALLGAVAGNQYAQAHEPPCVNVPAGPPCRYLDDDSSSTHRTVGIALGAGLGALIGAVLAR